MLSEDQFVAFLDAAPDAMVIADDRGTIAFVNSAAETMFQYTRGELAGRPIETLLPERLAAGHAGHVNGYISAPRRRPMGAGLDLFARRKDGSEFPVEISLSPLTTDSGIFVSSAIRDISARKAVEQALIEARSAAERSDRAKSAFLAAASHDLRQPLQSLMLLSSVLGRAVPSNSEAAIVAANQAETLRLMAELLNSLLDISKLEAGTVKPEITDFSVQQILAKLRSEFSNLAAAKGLNLVVDNCEAVVRSDANLLMRIVQNLVANAIRYTQKGWVQLHCMTTANAVMIEVLDTGIGIAADELERVFEDYYQTRESAEAFQGVGLGLAIARRLSGLLGCTLDARSTVGEGSCFTLNVPRADSDEANESARAETFVAGMPQDALVLVIDDDRAVGDAIAMLLRTFGLEVLLSATVEGALAAVSGHGAMPDLLICDYHLGKGASGIDAIRSIRDATRASLPVIVVSGDTSQAIEEAFKPLSECHLLSKPFEAETLSELACRLLSRTAA